MDKQMFRCDICGDVEQWKSLVKTYMDQHDYPAAEGIVKKILEAVPSDKYANDLYALLQVWRYLEIVNGTLVKYHGKVQDIVLPEGIHTIGKQAFARKGIRSVVLPASVAIIEEQAFDRCSRLEFIDLSNVLSCASYCFRGCKSLSQVNLPRNMSEIPCGMFEDTGIVQIDIPAGVKTIGIRAFANCQSLKTVHLPDGLETIGCSAFYGCKALEQISIPSTVTTLAQQSFLGCTNLTKVHLSQELLERIKKSWDDHHSGTHNDGHKPFPTAWLFPFTDAPWWIGYINQKK